MKLTLYNTLPRSKEVFKPLKKTLVRVYSCGPTVYDFAHIGNMRSFLLSDILRRVLLYNGFKVKLVMNITDVGHLTSDADFGDDKIEKSARTKGESAWDIAARYTRAFEHDRDALNILPATFQPNATDHILEQIKLVSILEKKGFTYKTSDGIYFDTSKFPTYGKLSRQKLGDKKGGARVELGEKRQATDFALWKFSARGEQRQMEWKSPWGVGFPGWHLECSAMSVKYLGQPFDIHTGGVDHLAVHHENEIAQSEAATGKPLARYWLHGEFLVLPKRSGASDKMSKSLDNIFTIQELQKLQISPLAYRYFCLNAHYRKPLVFSEGSLRSAGQALRRLQEHAEALPTASRTGVVKAEQAFLEAINDDLNMPKALAVTWDMVRNKKNKPAAIKSSLLRFDNVLGLNLAKAKTGKEKIPVHLQKLLHQRETARTKKNWVEADKARAEILKAGYRIEDTSSGPVLKKN